MKRNRDFMWFLFLCLPDLKLRGDSAGCAREVCTGQGGNRADGAVEGPRAQANVRAAGSLCPTCCEAACIALRRDALRCDHPAVCDSSCVALLAAIDAEDKLGPRAATLQISCRWECLLVDILPGTDAGVRAVAGGPDVPHGRVGAASQRLGCACIVRVQLGSDERKSRLGAGVFFSLSLSPSPSETHANAHKPLTGTSSRRQWSH
jgi:hypothetical protein